MSRGYRFLGQTAFNIADAATYEDACEKEYVVVDPVRRRAMIRRQIEAVAAENGGTAEISEALLEEVYVSKSFFLIADFFFCDRSLVIHLLFKIIILSHN